jgi:hypothetical protein
MAASEAAERLGVNTSLVRFGCPSRRSARVGAHALATTLERSFCASRTLSHTLRCAILESSVLPFALPWARCDVAMTQAQESRPDVELPERRPADDDDEAQVLTSTVRAAERTLRSVLERRQLFEAGALDDVERTVAEVDRRLTRRELRVVVLGERNSGKSTLLDAIVGDRLLGGARRQAAVVTFLRQSNAPRYRARFSSGKVDDFASRSHPC